MSSSSSGSSSSGGGGGGGRSGGGSSSSVYLLPLSLDILRSKLVIIRLRSSSSIIVIT